MKHYVLIGATSAIAQHCARLWVAEGAARLTLVGRDAQRLAAVAEDLRVRSPASQVGVRTCDFLDPSGIAELAEACFEEGPVDVVLVAHGALIDQADSSERLDACLASLQVNGVSPALFAEAFAGRMARAGQGTLAVIGSVAGDRGRQSNYTYGAAKGLVERYAQGLQHRFARTGVRVVLVKPGPTDTPMTAALKQAGRRLAPVDAVARDIVRGIEAGRRVVYTPGIWRLIMWVVRLVPTALFHRTSL